MAGIFANIDSDITQLDKLKKKIEEIKKALKSIDINTDIGKGMEAQLRSLLSQYDTLVNKIAEAEAKVKLSVANINKAMETINRQTPKPTGEKPSSKPDTDNEDEARRAKIVEQAYKDLSSVIRENATEFDKQVTKWNEASNAIRIYGEEIKKIKAEQKSRGTDFTEAETRRIGTLNAAIEANRQKRNEASREIRNQIKVYQAAEGSLNQLRGQLIQMKNAYAEMSDRGTKEAQEMLAAIQQTNAKVSEIEQSMGVYSRNVGNYASGWNGLSMSIQQIGRELPSLAVGWSTFFLAISNNLPILSDELARARKEYNELKAAGQQATPVWKQVVSSLLSWQTALTVGITLLTLYGKEIVEWVGGLFKAKKEISILADEQKKLNAAMADSRKDAVKMQTDLRVLYDMTQNVNASMESRLQAVNKLQKQYPAYFGNLSKEAILAGQASSVYQQLTKDLMDVAYAQAYQNRMQQLANKAVEEKRGKNADTNYINRNKDAYEIAKSRLYDKNRKWALSNEDVNLITEYERRQIRLAEHQKNIAELEAQMNAYSKEIQKHQNEIAKTDGTWFEGTEESKDKAVSALKDYLSEMTSLVEDNEERQVELMKEGTDKEVAEIELRYKRMREKVQELENNLRKAQGGKLTDGQKAVFDTAYTGIGNLQSRDVNKAREDAAKERIKEEREAMNEYLKEYGTYQQKRLAITEEYQRKIAEAATQGGRMTLQKQMEESLKELDFSRFKGGISFADIFGNLDAQTTSALKSLRDKLEEYINNAAKGLRPEDLKDLQDAFKDLDLKIAERDPFGEFGKALDEYRTAQGEVSKAQQDLNAVMQGGEVITGVYADETGKLVVQTLSQAQAEERLNSAQKKRSETLADLKATINSIGSQGMQLVNAGNEIVGMLENFGVEVHEAVSSTLSGIGQVMSGLESIDITKPFSLITGAVSVFAGIGNTIAGWFGGGDRKNEKQIQRLQDQIDALSSSYDKLGRSVEDAYGKDASNLIEQQNKLLEQHKVLIQQQIREEEDKKHTDEGRIKEWKQQIEEINETLEDNKEAAVDAIFGEDLQSAIENFADAYAEAWTSGEDKAKSAKDTVKKMMQQMVSTSIKAAIQSSGAMEEIRTKLKQFYEDNVLSGWEQDYIYNMAEELQKELDSKFGWADSLFESDGAEKQQSASGKGFETMTQDQASELSGRFTAVAESSYRIEGAITQLSGNVSVLSAGVSGMYSIADEARGILASSYLELQQISENTGAIIAPIQKIQKDIEIVKNNTSRL